MQLPIPNRTEAGRALADDLSAWRQREDLLVLALPRGGVPVAYEIASALGAGLDLLTVRKLGTPGHRELAMGAIASGGIRAINEDVVRVLGIRQEDIEAVAREEQAELERREQTYRGERELPALANRSVVLVDDGVATGATMLAAIDAVRSQGVAEVRVAVPVAPPETVEKLRRKADDVICLATPEPFTAISRWYEHFGQTSDEEVMDLLQRAWERESAAG